MKICHVINSLNRGGAETHLLDLITEQNKNGYLIDLIVIGEDSRNIISLEAKFSNMGIRIERLKGPRMFNLFSYIKLYKIITRNRYNVIHSHQPRSDYMIYFMKKYIKDFRWVVSVHGKYDTYLESRNFSNKFKKRFMLSLANYWGKSDAIIAISDAVRDWVLNLNNNLKPMVIPYWVDQTHLNSKYAPKTDISIGFLGRLNKNKGIEDLLEVFNDIQDENINLKIGGHAEESYLQYLNKISLEEKRKNIHFLGYVKNRKKFFDSIDIFVFPSFSEGLGLVLLEAMSFSKICLTRDISPMNEYLTHESGYLFINNNQMLNCLEEAIKDFRHDANKIKSKLFKIEEVVKKSSVASIFPLIEKVYSYE